MTRERRRFTRARQPFDAKYRVFREIGEPWNTTTILNLSAGGMRFQGTDLVTVGDTLEMHIRLPNDPQPIVLQGRVIWSQLQAAGVTENGLEFIEVSADQQLRIDELVRFLRTDPRSSP